jgi:hypothetical protein
MERRLFFFKKRIFQQIRFSRKIIFANLSISAREQRRKTMINKAKFIPVLFTAAFFSSLTGCYCEDCGESCSNVYDFESKLADCQKTIGHYKKGKTIHYEHSNGYDLDFTVSKDTIYHKRESEYCANFDTEVREIELTSTYPIMSLKLIFNGGYEYENEEDGSTDFISSLNVSASGVSYVVDLNSDGTPIEFSYKDNLEMLDTITFNGVKYDSVFVIYDLLYASSTDHADNRNQPRLYFSKEKGILKIESRVGHSLTIKEGGDNE